jgi:hypothetical protein
VGVTMQSWRSGPPSSIPLVQEPTPQRQHIRDHLRGSIRRLSEDDLDEYMLVVEYLCEPMSFAEISKAINPDGTSRRVETRWDVLVEVMCLSGFGSQSNSTSSGENASRRIRLVRYVFGIDKCWCEF